MAPALSVPAVNTQPGSNPSWDKAIIKDIKSLAINYSITLPVLMISPTPPLDDNVSLGRPLARPFGVSDPYGPLIAATSQTMPTALPHRGSSVLQSALGLKPESTACHSATEAYLQSFSALPRETGIRSSGEDLDVCPEMV